MQRSYDRQGNAPFKFSFDIFNYSLMLCACFYSFRFARFSLCPHRLPSSSISSLLSFALRLTSFLDATSFAPALACSRLFHCVAHTFFVQLSDDFAHLSVSFCTHFCHCALCWQSPWDRRMQNTNIFDFTQYIASSAHFISWTSVPFRSTRYFGFSIRFAMQMYCVSLCVCESIQCLPLRYIPLYLMCHLKCHKWHLVCVRKPLHRARECKL